MQRAMTHLLEGRTNNLIDHIGPECLGSFNDILVAIAEVAIISLRLCSISFRSRLGRRHSGSVKRLSATRHPEWLRRHSSTPYGAAVVAVPSSDRHHDGGLAADSPYNKSEVLGGFRGVSPAVVVDPPPIAAPRRRQWLVKPPQLLRWCSDLAVVKRRDGGGGEGGRSVVVLVGAVAAADGGGWLQQTMVV
ncbi:hypothetical protein Tco_0316573 [Tanacetum coccineum]